MRVDPTRRQGSHLTDNEQQQGGSCLNPHADLEVLSSTIVANSKDMQGEGGLWEGLHG